MNLIRLMRQADVTGLSSYVLTAREEQFTTFFIHTWRHHSSDAVRVADMASYTAMLARAEVKLPTAHSPDKGARPG